MSSSVPDQTRTACCCTPTTNAACPVHDRHITRDGYSFVLPVGGIATVADEMDRLRAENEMLREAFCDEAYILMVQALDVKALAKGRRRILTEQAIRMANVGLGKGNPRHPYPGRLSGLKRRAQDVLDALSPSSDETNHSDEETR